MAGTIYTNPDKTGSQTLGVDITKVYTTQDFPLGSTVTLQNGAKYEFVKATGSIAQYALCVISTAGVLSALATAAAVKSKLTVPQLALAANEYAFVPRANCTGSVTSAASINAGVGLTTTTTAGTVGAGGTAISGLTLTSASGGGGTTACQFTADCAIL